MCLSYCTKYQGTNFKIHEPYISLLLWRTEDIFYPGELGCSASRLNLIFQTQISILSTPKLQDRLCLAYASCPTRAKRCMPTRVLACSQEAAMPATCLREGETERNPKYCGDLARSNHPRQTPRRRCREQEETKKPSARARSAKDKELNTGCWREAEPKHQGQPRAGGL